MKILLKIIEIMIINVLFSTILLSQNSIFNNEVFAIHLRGGLAFNTYIASFDTFQGVTDCGSYNSGSGTGLLGELGIEIPVFSKSHIGLSFSITDKGGTLNTQGGFPSRDSTTGKIIQIQTENSINAKINYLSIRPEFFSVLTDRLINGPFRYSVGINMDIPVAHTFTQNERILSPDNATFNYNGKQVRERVIISDVIRNMNIPVLGIVLGFENMLRTGNNSYFTQQLILEYN